jgi:flagellar basal body-associated protein FliL
MNTVMLLVLIILLILVLVAVFGWFVFAEHRPHQAAKTDDDQHLFI